MEVCRLSVFHFLVLVQGKTTFFFNACFKCRIVYLFTSLYQNYFETELKMEKKGSKGNENQQRITQ